MPEPVSVKKEMMEGAELEMISAIHPSVWEYGILTGVQIGKMRLLIPVELVLEKERVSE